MELNPESLFAQYIPIFAGYSVQIVMAFVIFFTGRWAARMATNLLVKQMEKHAVDAMIVSFVSSLLYWALLAFVCLAALAQVGIQTASFIAVLGAAGLAVGLALQGSLANFASGILMLVFKPFKLGDYIEAAGTAGIVTAIRIFSIVLLTPDNKQIIIPNSAVMNGNITNFSAQNKRRVDVKFGVSYDAYIPDVKKVIEDILANEELILKDEPTLIAVSELGDSSVNFVVRAWTKTGDYWPLFFKLTETIKLKLDENKIKIPYPQMDVHLQKVD